MSRKPAIGIFLARAWYEDDQFRARVTQGVDVDAEPMVNSAIADLDELMRAFNAWLTELAQRPPGPHAEPP